MTFTYEPHSDDTNYGYMKTSTDKYMYIRDPTQIKRMPTVLMRHYKYGNEKLFWVIENNALFYKIGGERYCVPFLADKEARLHRCRWMTLGGFN